MKRGSSLFLFGFVAFACYSAFVFPIAAQEASPTGTTTRIDRIIQQYIDQYGVPGMSVAVAHENTIVYSKAFGLADVEHSVAATAATRYRTASIAKPITAALLLSLVEDGKLALDAPVQSYVRRFPDKKWPLNSRQLLGHIGGVRHYKSSAEASSTKHFFDLDSALATFADDPLLHEPGTKYRYSSFGYNLLGSVAEGSGQASFMELLDERVLKPAGMKNTVADDSFAVIPNRSRGYIRPTPSMRMMLSGGPKLKAGELYNSTLHDTSMKIPGGGLLSTAEDLVRFATAINAGAMLKPKTRDLMWTSLKTNDGRLTNYGLGWQVGRKSGQDAVWHGGAQSGTSTMLLLFPDSGTCVALMCNLQRMSLMGTAEAIANVVDPPRYN